MHNHFTVTITDDTGVKQFDVNKIIKKIIIYAIAFLALFVFISIIVIYYLSSNLNEIETKKEQITKAYLKLDKKHKRLQKDIVIIQKELNDKRTKLSELSDSLSEIETLIGLKPSKDLTLTQRVDLTKLSSQNIATMLEFIPNGSPIKYNGITSKYGWRVHPMLHKKEFHPGIDLKAKLKTPVYATADGIIEFAGYHKKSGYGNLIIIDNNYGFKTYFGHLYKIKVKAGEFVQKGKLIALTGNTGLSNGPHLHYEVRFIQRPLNPYWFIKWGIDNFNEIFTKEKNIPWQSLITAMRKLKIKTTPQQQAQQSSQ